MIWIGSGGSEGWDEVCKKYTFVHNLSYSHSLERLIFSVLVLELIVCLKLDHRHSSEHSYVDSQ